MFTSRRGASCSCPTIDEKIDAAHSPLGQGQCRGLSVLSSIQRQLQLHLLPKPNQLLGDSNRSRR